MGIQTMGSQNNANQSLSQPSPLARQNSWYSLTLNEVEKQLGNLSKPLGSMNLDELLKNVWTAEATRSNARMDIESTPSSSLPQRQASLTLARALSGKTVDLVWKEIQLGRKTRYSGDNNNVKSEGRAPTLGEVTLEDFLVQAGLFAEASLGSSVELDSSVDLASPQSLRHQLSLSPSPSMVGFSGRVSSCRKRDQEAVEKSIERKLKRKIKNRESAARSRARKQAYHNELVNKVSHLEEDNIKLKKEKEFDQRMLPCEESSVAKYQLRRTSSASF